MLSEARKFGISVGDGVSGVLRDNKFKIHKDFVCSTYTKEDERQNKPNPVIENMRMQMLCYERVQTAANSRTGEVGVRVTGKHNGRDDLVVTLTRAAYGQYVFRTSEYLRI